jgi:hypothetical protein
MGYSIEVIKLRDVLRVQAITRFVPGLPKTVELKGENFSSAVEVTFNDINSPEFLLVNKSTIYARLPDEVDQVREVSVISSSFTRTGEASKVFFKFGEKTKPVSGVLRLTQLFTMQLLKSPGSDIFDREDGGGLQEVVGLVSSTYKTDGILGTITNAVKKTEQQIRRNQIGQVGLSLNERLLAATILDLRMARDSDNVVVRIRIDTVAGESALTTMDI